MATPIAPLDPDNSEQAERHLRSVTPQAQLGFDEKVVDYPDLLTALDNRLAKKVVADQARKAYDEAAEIANAEIAELRMSDGDAVRCGRFRITKRAISAKTVSFDAKASSRIQITLLDED